MATARLSDTTSPALAIYVHWPFCLSKCPYCDFNSHVRERIDAARWRRAYVRETDHWADQLPGRTIGSIFFGGGTPSLMAPETVATLIEHIAERWTLSDGAEITLEANPTSTEAQRLADFRAAGINRVSLGVQALDDDALRFLGRGHDQAEARAAVGLAQSIMPRSSFDLIYARPGQDIAAWRAELKDALTLADGHISLYQLTIEKGTPFYALWRDNDLRLPDDTLGAALYEATQEITAAAGLPAYEISNHATAGEPCRHNLHYWRYDDFVGIGPGAHGRIEPAPGTLLATRQHAKPEAWLEAVEALGHATAESRVVSPHEKAEEFLMMGLRLSEGIDLTRFATRTGLAFDAVVDPVAMGRLVDAGLLEATAEETRATARGRAVLNALLGELLS